MEIYTAKSHFEPPTTDGSHNVISFQKGDKFEILDKGKSDGGSSKNQWWVGKRIESDQEVVGYIPSRYMKFMERHVGKLLDKNKREREKSLKKLAEMQSSNDHRHPDQMYNNLVLPEPDYDDDVGCRETDKNDNIYHSMPSIVPYEQYRDVMYPTIPEPDYEEGDNVTALRTMPLPQRSPPQVQQHTRSVTDPGTPIKDDDGLIIPRKLHNPCIESKERQALHRELVINKKAGIDVLKKSELEKTFERRRESQKKTEWETHKLTANRTSLEAHLAKQAEKIEEHAKQEEMLKSKIKEEEGNEFMRIHSKIRSRSITDSDSS